MTKFQNLKIAITDKDHLKAVCDVPCRTSGVLDKEYKLWRDVLKRCFSEKFHTKHPTYKGCTISKDWLVYSEFKNDVSEMIGFGVKGFEIDKDLKVKGNKLYSKETCCFLPHELNSFLVIRTLNRGDYPVGVDLHKRTGLLRVRVSINGVVKNLGYFSDKEKAFNEYKKAKENQARYLAEKWKDSIDHCAYVSLMNFQVCIND